MGEEFTARTFKSGNSVALRLPKALGVREGLEMRVRAERGQFIVEPIDAPKRKFNVAKVWGIGKHLDLKPIAAEDRVFEHRPLVWEDQEPAASFGKREP